MKFVLKAENLLLFNRFHNNTVDISIIYTNLIALFAAAIYNIYNIYSAKKRFNGLYDNERRSVGNMCDGIKNIKLVNCNCIKQADSTIQSNTLNIKYGCNGTGKSTISRAIYLKAKNDIEGLKLLCPYKINPEDPELPPEIEN